MAYEYGRIPLPIYECHKKVGALKIARVDIHGDNSCTITPENKHYSAFMLSPEYNKKHKPQVGGYYVVYDDGYQSWSPAKAFEEGYSLIS